ncbi:MAG: hypothetical protein QXG16_05025, partial [Candidatus Anstonellaceae archaeon]
ALVIMLDNYHSEMPINISTGNGVAIKELVEIVKEVVGFEGKITWDPTKPDGHPVKIFDVTRMNTELSFQPKTNLKDGVRKTYNWFISNLDKLRL